MNMYKIYYTHIYTKFDVVSKCVFVVRFNVSTKTVT